MKRQLAAIAAFVLLAGAPAYAATPTEIVVTGSGTVALTPDIAQVSATITTNAENAAAAVTANNSRYDDAVEAVARIGVRRDDITLSSYNVNYVPKPQSSVERPETQEPPGYTVTRSFDIKVRAMSKAGAVVDAVTSVDGATIGGVGFAVADPSPGQRQATTLAVNDARAQGQALAAAAGLHIVGIKQISQGGTPEVRPMMRAMAMEAPSPTTFDASSVAVRADVTIIYLAEP
jgi:uncharacterized protein